MFALIAFCLLFSAGAGSVLALLWAVYYLFPTWWTTRVGQGKPPMPWERQ